MIVIVLFGFVVFRGAPYVPSKRKEIAQAFTELYALDNDDLLVDIGSGDGIVLREASRRGARAVGYELNPLLVLISRFISRKDDKVSTYLADFWRVKLPAETTVVYTFGESRDIARMAKKVSEEADRLGKPLAFISFGFMVPGQEPLKKLGAYYLYQYTPLHIKKA
jgi:hypothetical protein